MYEIFERLLKEKGVSTAEVCKAIGMRQGVISDWKYGRYTPKVDKLTKIADYFGVSLEYLQTGSEANQAGLSAVDSLLLTIGFEVKHTNDSIMIRNLDFTFHISADEYYLFQEDILSYTAKQVNALIDKKQKKVEIDISNFVKALKKPITQKEWDNYETRRNIHES